MTKMSLAARMLRDRRGATAVEYVMMAAILGIIAIAGAQQLASELNRLHSGVTDRVAAATASSGGEEGGGGD